MDKESVVNRTRKILYVCCTRAKSNLALFYHSPSDAVVEKAKDWFGHENVKNLD
jgi:DNA helicase-2/ATP-dependent DNA helicase PcrA